MPQDFFPLEITQETGRIICVAEKEVTARQIFSVFLDDGTVPEGSKLTSSFFQVKRDNPDGLVRWKWTLDWSSQ